MEEPLVAAEPQNSTGPKPEPQNDIYTLLLIVAAALLLCGTIFLAVRSSQLLGSVWPPGGG